MEMRHSSNTHHCDIEKNSNDKGFVLVSVIWIAGLLAVLATAFTISVRSHILAGRNIVQGERARYLADGMVEFMALDLATKDGAEAGQLTNGTAQTCTWADNARISTFIQDQAGLLDLNTAPSALMAALLQGVGADEAKAATILAALRDFRDPDAEAADGESEPQFYPGKAFGPKNAPFSDPAELDQMPGMEKKLFEQLMQVTTVYSQQSGIDLDAAPKILLDELGIVDKTSPQAQNIAAPSPRRVYAIDAAVELKDGSRYVRHAIISLLRQPDRPFAILSWQRGIWPSQVNLSTATDAKPCLN